MKKIYLCGPMDFVTTEHQKSWREEAKEYVKSGCFEFLDPTCRPHDGDLTFEEIVEEDLKDIKDSDIILAEVNEIGVPVFGTTCEIFYASYVLKKPVIGWYNKERKEGKRIFQTVLLEKEFPSLYEALDYLMESYV